LKSSSAKALLATTLAVAALAGSAGSADAVTAHPPHVISVPATVTIESRGAELVGTISSDYAPCERGRVVSLFKLLPGGAQMFFGGDYSDRDGRWKAIAVVEKDLLHGHFFVEVRAGASRRQGDNSYCQAVRSKVFKPSRLVIRPEHEKGPNDS
jgi:hypothetical protein